MESIGTQLRQAREQKGASLSQAASATRIKYQHLESMEADDFSNIAAAAYARGFIKIYAEYLGLSPEPLIEAYTRRHDPRPVRQGLNADDLPAAPGEAPEEAEAVSDAVPPDRNARRELLARVGIPVLTIVVLVLALVALARLAGGGGDDGDRPEPEAGDPPAPAASADLPPLLIEDPPDAFIQEYPAEGQP